MMVHLAFGGIEPDAMALTPSFLGSKADSNSKSETSAPPIVARYPRRVFRTCSLWISHSKTMPAIAATSGSIQAPPPSCTAADSSRMNRVRILEPLLLLRIGGCGESTLICLRSVILLAASFGEMQPFLKALARRLRALGRRRFISRWNLTVFAELRSVFAA